MGTWIRHRYLSSFAMLVVAGTLTLGGCNRSGNQQASHPAAQPQNPQQNPEQNPQPGGQPAAGQLAAGTVPAPGSPSSSTASEAAAPPPTPPATSEGAPPPPTSPSQPPTLDIPNGTHLRVRLDQDLGSKISQTGDSFSATVADDVVVDGTTVIPRGAHAEGTVIDAKPLGRFKGAAALELRLERVRTKWGSYRVSTSTIDRAESGKGKRSAGLIGGGGGFGALVGGLAGGGKGALIGVLAGAGAGTAGSAFTGNKQIVLPAETLLTFRLERSVHVTE
jgi:hypothetical protein